MMKEVFKKPFDWFWLALLTTILSTIVMIYTAGDLIFNWW